MAARRADPERLVELLVEEHLLAATGTSSTGRAGRRLAARAERGQLDRHQASPRPAVVAARPAVAARIARAIGVTAGRLPRARRRTPAPAIEMAAEVERAADEERPAGRPARRDRRRSPTSARPSRRPDRARCRSGSRAPIGGRDAVAAGDRASAHRGAAASARRRGEALLEPERRMDADQVARRAAARRPARPGRGRRRSAASAAPALARREQRRRGSGRSTSASISRRVSAGSTGVIDRAGRPGRARRSAAPDGSGPGPRPRSGRGRRRSRPCDISSTKRRTTARRRSSGRRPTARPGRRAPRRARPRCRSTSSGSRDRRGGLERRDRAGGAGRGALVGDHVAGDLEEPDPERRGALAVGRPGALLEPAAARRASRKSARWRPRRRGGRRARSRRSCTPGRGTSGTGRRTAPGRAGPPRRARDRDRGGRSGARPASSAALTLPNTGRAIALHRRPGGAAGRRTMADLARRGSRALAGRRRRVGSTTRRARVGVDAERRATVSADPSGSSSRTGRPVVSWRSLQSATSKWPARRARSRAARGGRGSVEQRGRGRSAGRPRPRAGWSSRGQLGREVRAPASRR